GRKARRAWEGVGRTGAPDAAGSGVDRNAAGRLAAAGQHHVRGRVQGDALAPPSPAPGHGSLIVPAMNMIEALNSALDVMLERDPDVLIFGEDVGYFGGVFRVTDGLQKKHGLTRCFDTPIGEAGIVAVAIGMGAYGLRPVVEIQFADYIYPAY